MNFFPSVVRGTHAQARVHRLATAASLLLLGVAGSVAGQTATGLKVTEADCIIKSFAFSSGETLPELRFHYRTLGAPVRNARGRVRNAVLILHGTGSRAPASAHLVSSEAEVEGSGVTRSRWQR